MRVLRLLVALMAAARVEAAAVTPAGAGAAVPPAASGRAAAVTPAKIDTTRICPLPSGPPVPLESFGAVIWRKTITLGAWQALSIGNLFYGPGARVELGVLTGRFRDRIYVRTNRRLLREWRMPAAGQPDTAVAWAGELVHRFDVVDSLFVDIPWGSAPIMTTGAKAGQMAGLFERWVASGLTAEDRQLASRLGLPASRFTAPPEPACPPGGG